MGQLSRPLTAAARSDRGAAMRRQDMSLSTQPVCAQEQMEGALSQSLSPAEGELAEAELERLEADYAKLEAAEQLPSVPVVGSLHHSTNHTLQVGMCTLRFVHQHVGHYDRLMAWH